MNDCHSFFSERSQAVDALINVGRPVRNGVLIDVLKDNDKS